MNDAGLAGKTVPPLLIQIIFADGVDPKLAIAFDTHRKNIGTRDSAAIRNLTRALPSWLIEQREAF
jgi:hypothetical protein